MSNTSNLPETLSKQHGKTESKPSYSTAILRNQTSIQGLQNFHVWGELYRLPAKQSYTKKGRIILKRISISSHLPMFLAFLILFQVLVHASLSMQQSYIVTSRCQKSSSPKISRNAKINI